MIRTPNEMGYRAGETGKPPPTTPRGVGTAALGPSETAPEIAPSADGAMDDWEFRPLRRAGVSLAAASGNFAPCAGRPKALPLETAIF